MHWWWIEWTYWGCSYCTVIKHMTHWHKKKKTFLPFNFIGFLFHIIDRYFLKKKKFNEDVFELFWQLLTEQLQKVMFTNSSKNQCCVQYYWSKLHAGKNKIYFLQNARHNLSPDFENPSLWILLPWIPILWIPFPLNTQHLNTQILYPW